jgi:Family of unknown function (DUF6328)
MGNEKNKTTEQQEELSLSKAEQYLLEECRMVLPGIQALFGFQLVVVFSQGFSDKLNDTERLLHLIAIALVALAVAIIMTPAALHRRTGSRLVTSRLIEVSARLLLWSMLPLAVGISLEFYLIARVIVGSRWVLLVALALFGVFMGLWFVLPRSRALQRTSNDKLRHELLKS